MEEEEEEPSTSSGRQEEQEPSTSSGRPTRNKKANSLYADFVSIPLMIIAVLKILRKTVHSGMT